MVCRIRHRIVRYFAPEWCVKSLFQKAGILCKGEQSGFPPQSFPTPQNHHHQPLFILEDAAGRIIEEVFAVAADDRQVSQSGKPLCTGASLWAVPKLARGLCPLEPWHANGGNSVLEISTGYFFSDCHGLAKTLSCIYQRGTLHIPLWNPLLI